MKKVVKGLSKVLLMLALVLGVSYSPGVGPSQSVSAAIQTVDGHYVVDETSAVSLQATENEHVLSINYWKTGETTIHNVRFDFVEENLETGEHSRSLMSIDGGRWQQTPYSMSDVFRKAWWYVYGTAFD